jgi:hypothetical protein
VARRVKLVSHPTVKQLDAKFARRGLVRLPKPDHRAITFRVASYNLLGASHTTGRRARKGYGSAAQRLPAQISLLERHGVSVAGLQEFQPPQINHFLRIRGGSYDVYPGVSLGPRPSDNSIIWRTDTWELVAAQTTGVPYFGGRYRQMPQVLLRHNESGREMWFGNFHNPANIGGNHARWRQAAIRIEAGLADDLGANGTPVIMTGDMNDRSEYACPFSALSGMHSPDGARTVDGSCRTPRGMSVDWIMGSGFIEFNDYAQDWSSRHRRLSDHPVIAATAILPGVSDRAGCVKAWAAHGVEHYCPVS